MSITLKNILFYKYFWLILIVLSIGWLMLAARLEVRTYKAFGEQLESVKQIWGDNLAQPMPSIRYKRFGSDVSSLNQGELNKSNIKVKLTMDYRKKGLVYYTGYNASFEGHYTIQNTENENIYLSFIFPYPSQEGVLQNVKLLINGEEDVDDTEYQPQLILWTGILNPADTLNISVHYEGRGLNQFEYGFEPGIQVNQFTMVMEVHGAEDLDYAESTMPPTEAIQDLPQGKRLTWHLNRTLSQFNIGVILPDKLNVEKQLFIMNQRVPVFFVLFLVTLTLILQLADKKINFIPIAVISIAYFLFYPFLAYLAAYLDIILAFVIAFISIGMLIFNYVRSLYGIKMALAVFTAYSFFLGITSVAALLPTYTGLILTIEGVVLIGIMMQVLSKYRDLTLEEVSFWKPQLRHTQEDNHETSL